MTKEIKLTKGYVALVDEEDYEWLSQFKWCVNSDGYAVKASQNGFKRIAVRMHREILQAPKNFDIDHVNCNRLDNRRSNLRLATKSQNQSNRGAQKNSVSGYKGVSWNKQCKKWKAQIANNSKDKYLGLFNTSEEAAKAYDIAARELHGEFAKTNFE